MNEVERLKLLLVLPLFLVTVFALQYDI